MNLSTEGVQRFLRGQSAALDEARNPRGGLFPFVTLSRQAGAGGHALAQAIVKEADRLGREEALFHGWQIVDQGLVERLLEDPKLHVTLRELMDEAFHTEIEDYVNTLIAGTSPQRLVYRRVFETVRKLATGGKAVILGRAGSVVTRGLPGGVHIRLIASRPTRIQAMMERYKLGHMEAERQMDELDASRARLLRTYFHHDIDDPHLYDAVWNADSCRLAAIARAVVSVARDKAALLKERSAEGASR